MKIALAGHGWNEHYVLTQGSGMDAERMEAAAPGGALWLAECLRHMGHDISIPQGTGEIKNRYFNGTQQANGTVAWHAAGSTQGRSLFLPAEGCFIVALDEGYEPFAIPEGCARLLWASKERIPDAQTAASFPSDTALMLDAGVLRACGALVSRQVSWERTTTDALWQLMNNPSFRHLLRARQIIVTFAEEGFLAVSLEKEAVTGAALYLESGAAEGTTRAACPGEHPMAWPLTVASAAACAADDVTVSLSAAFPAARSSVLKAVSFADIRSDGGLEAASKLLDAGYAMGTYRLPIPDSQAADIGYWRILDSISSITMDKLAESIVLQGLHAIAGVPSIRFGKLVSIDRAEVESFMSIRNLISEYASGTESRPLSIAVFGAPGSGKSFGIQQVAENILPNKVKKIEFNLSQFAHRNDLCAAFHKVRDMVLGGMMPLVIFDEFDSYCDGQRLGWLKSFLMPMQDGKFVEGEAEHPLGRCIFIFAGGTCAAFEQFCAPMDASAGEGERLAYTQAKVPDFISRLRGTLNVLGPNRKDENDKSFLLRRALLLRSLCERKLKQCISGDTLHMDKSLLEAMLLVPKYMHGARSMESIIDMSRAADCRVWEPSSLPSHSQLALHVDADAFSRLLLRDLLLSSSRESLARAIHENYRKIQAEKKLTSSVLANTEWEALDTDTKNANRSQADDIINKLGRFGFGFDAGDSFYDTVTELPAEKVELMAEHEHIRWMEQKASSGWTYAPGSKDDVKRTSPYMVEWSMLDDKTKELDRDAVRNIIPLLQQIGLRVYKRD